MDVNRSERTDDELVRQFCSGSGEAFEALVYRYKNSLYQYLFSLVQDEGTASDLFQEVFLSFFKNASKYVTIFGTGTTHSPWTKRTNRKMPFCTKHCRTIPPFRWTH